MGLNAKLDGTWTNPPRRRLAGLARITNPDGKVLVLLSSRGMTWLLPGGTAIEGESAVQAVRYQIRRKLRLHVEVGPAIAIDHVSANPVNGATEGLNIVFDCGQLTAEQIASIKLPDVPKGTEPEILEYTFMDHQELLEKVPQWRRAMAAEAATIAKVGIPYLEDGKPVSNRAA
ncbi:NUDIX hydrolase [Streptomyces klenkii]|uniref:NUDIX hydrolase n=1 Tax=Streptomyces klenkii TaxID=1420899 RepID=UPI003444E318